MLTEFRAHHLRRSDELDAELDAELAAPAGPIEDAARPTMFGRRLQTLRFRAGLSQNAVARAAGCDPAYVNRLERATETTPLGPSRSVVIRLWLATSTDDDALDALLADAGLLPESIARDGGWELFMAGWRGQVRVLEHKLELAHKECRRLATEAVRRLRVLHGEEADQ